MDQCLMQGGAGWLVVWLAVFSGWFLMLLCNEKISVVLKSKLSNRLVGGASVSKSTVTRLRPEQVKHHHHHPQHYYYYSNIMMMGGGAV